MNYKGKVAETLVYEYMTAIGFVCKRNIRIQHDEIDLVCERGNSLVFIEIRYRSSLYITPISDYKRYKIIRACCSYRSTDDFDQFKRAGLQSMGLNPESQNMFFKHKSIAEYPNTYRNIIITLGLVSNTSEYDLRLKFYNI